MCGYGELGLGTGRFVVYEGRTTCRQKNSLMRQRQDLNLCVKTTVDFESTPLTARARCQPISVQHVRYIPIVSQPEFKEYRSITVWASWTGVHIVIESFKHTVIP